MIYATAEKTPNYFLHVDLSLTSADVNPSHW